MRFSRIVAVVTAVLALAVVGVYTLVRKYPSPATAPKPPVVAAVVPVAPPPRPTPSPTPALSPSPAPVAVNSNAAAPIVAAIDRGFDKTVAAIDRQTAGVTTRQDRTIEVAKNQVQATKDHATATKQGLAAVKQAIEKACTGNCPPAGPSQPTARPQAQRNRRQPPVPGRPQQPVRRRPSPAAVAAQAPPVPASASNPGTLVNVMPTDKPVSDPQQSVGGGQTVVNFYYPATFLAAKPTAPFSAAPQSPRQPQHQSWLRRNILEHCTCDEIEKVAPWRSELPKRQ